MSFTLCTSGSIVIRAGANVNSNAAASAALLEQFSNEAEGFINGTTRFDWVANYSSVGVNFKPMLAVACSCLAAVDLISYDKSGYTSQGEADNMINTLSARAADAIKFIQDEKTKTKMGVST